MPSPITKNENAYNHNLISNPNHCIASIDSDGVGTSESSSLCCDIISHQILASDTRSVFLNNSDFLCPPHSANKFLKVMECHEMVSTLNPRANCFNPMINSLGKSHLSPNAEPFIMPKTISIASSFSFYLLSFSFLIFIITIFLFYAIFDMKTDDIKTTYLDDKDITPYAFLKKLRLENINRLIIGHLNINSVRNKFDLLADMIRGNIDILLLTESKIDASFPKSQFLIQGYSEPQRLDRTSNGGGLLLYIRSDIPAKPLPLISNNIECLMTEIRISNKKWLLCGIYNPLKSQIKTFLSVFEENLCYYLSSYDNLLIFGDFNCGIDDEALNDFCGNFSLKSLIKSPTCFKNLERPTCIDLILTNKYRSFQNSNVIETGLSDFHLLTVTVLKSTFRKKPPKVIKYRDYRNYSYDHFRVHVNSELNGIDLHAISNDSYVNLISNILNVHAPIKTKYVRANDQPFMNKDLRKEHMKRSRLRNRYRKMKTTENEMKYKKQRNLCANLLKRAKSSYFEKLKPSSICDNKTFWKTVKPLFSEKILSSDNITLIEDDEIISDDGEIANIFNSHFNDAVKNLNISFDYQSECIINSSEDPTINAIRKYKHHPSIVRIKEKFPYTSIFSFHETDLISVIKEIGNLKDSKCSPI